MVKAKGREFYDRNYYEACTRQSLPHSREVIYPLAERTARLLSHRLRPSRVVDIGCAKGFLVEAFRNLGIPSAVGADISLYAVSNGEVTVRRRLMVANAQAGLPLRSACCDLVTAVDLFEHLADPTPVLVEIGRVLCPDGAAYLKICHPSHPNAVRDPSHVNVQALAYWRRAFSLANFTYERLYEAEFTPTAGPLGWLKRWVRRWREWAAIGTPADYKFLLRKRPNG